MKNLNTYLTFDGNCREAMSFYAKCLDGELQLMPFSEMPGDVPLGAKDRVMHANITKGPITLMASDSMPGMPVHQGNNFSISINCDSKEEVDRLFATLGENGKIIMAAQDTFWGAYFGMLADQFGIQWMFNFDYGRK